MTVSDATQTHRPARVLDDSAVDELRKAFDGELVRPGDAAYATARRAWNGMVDKYPALVVRPRGTADVVAAVLFARRHELEIAVRCGGHGTSGQSVSEGGIVIDLGLMRGVRVDPTHRRAWVQGGALLGDVDRESQLHGLATTGGVVSHTGVAGLTLGGGYGYLGRRFGLACDNVLSAEVVTASGDVLVASPDEHDDLYWGIRGGGGNFGVVTAFELQLHPFGPDILSVDLAYPADDGAPALRALLDLAADAPDAMTADASIVTARPSPMLPEPFHGTSVVFVSYTYTGDPEDGKAFLPRLRAGGDPIAEFVEVLPYLQLQRAGDEATRHGLRQYARSHFIRSTPDALIDAMLARGGHDPAVAAHAGLGQLGGAISRKSADEGAFSGRDALFDLVVTSTWEDPAMDAERLAAARAYGDSILPLSTGRSYVNAIDGEATAKVRSAFGEAIYDRLVAIKDRYDPDNVFHLNQNVRPSGPG
ncbi:MAG: FAD-binding oxidoreductase [Chloroflexota bacterium]